MTDLEQCLLISQTRRCLHQWGEEVWTLWVISKWNLLTGGESDFRITRHCLIKLLMLFWPIQLLQHGTPKQHWVYLPTHSVSTSVKGRIHTFEWCVLQFVGFLFPFRLCPNPHLEARSQQLKPSLQNQCETCWSAFMCQILLYQSV